MIDSRRMGGLSTSVKYATRGIAVLVGLLGVATATGFLDRVSWVFEPATIFRLQYAAVLVTSALIALALRHPYLALAAVALSGVNVLAIAPWQKGPRTAATEGPAFRIVAFNVDSSNHRYDALAPLVAQLRPDVLGLVELTPRWARAARSASSRLRPRLLVPLRGAYGMGLLSATSPIMVTARRFPADGPVALIARFRISGVTVTFVLVHVHTPFAGSVHERELRALTAARPGFGSRLIVCGDFNTVSWSAQFHDFSSSAHLTDVFRGDWHAYSWPSWTPLLAVPLDHCLISGGLAVRARHFGPSIGSDHFPLVLDVAITEAAA
jgi:endonuclease/exonuclease/phosphatase (EEP) superfamily protein YafD